MILMYHRVVSEKDLQRRFIQPGMYVLNHVFEKQIRFLKKHFQIVSFPYLLDRWQQKTYDLGKRYCVITFDDGWLDNYHYAFPILKRYSIPATIFLPTAFIGTRQWYWPEKISYLLEHFYNPAMTSAKREALCFLFRRYTRIHDIFMSTAIAINVEKQWERIDAVIEIWKELPPEEIDELVDGMSRVLEVTFPDERVFLNWEEIGQMSQKDISFGSHSCTHRILTKLPLMESKKEIELSKQTLLDKKLNYVPIFCYPNGNHNPELQNLVRDCGYQAAVTTRFGLENEVPQNLFALKRISVHNDISSTVQLFSLHVSGLCRGS